MSTTTADSTEMDLPLSANIGLVKLNHFLLDLECNMESRKLFGTITLFCSFNYLSNHRSCEPIEASNLQSTGNDLTSLEPSRQALSSIHGNLVITLDSFGISISSVEEVSPSLELENQMRTGSRTSAGEEDGAFVQCSRVPGREVQFEMAKHCVRITGLSPTQRGMCVVRIHYSTLPEGPSLKWTLDQDGNPCVFTIGHWLNNRSWFPSQDAPSVLTMWQARITVPANCTVLMSGDRKPAVSVHSQGKSIFYFYTTMPMPTSTLALAVGCWKEVTITGESSIMCSEQTSSQYLCTIHGEDCQTNFSNEQVLPCRLFAPSCVLSAALSELEHYVPSCMKQVYQILGYHPFQRLDILIVPPCFDSLGMMSPSLLFLAQSLLAGDQSMCARVAHEICHSWFGLLIGPKDWTEEWLTEGFCTYLEDILHAHVMGWQKDVMSDHLSLRCLLKERTLRAEVENTEESLQTLRPNKGEEALPPDDTTGIQYVKNGMNPNKAFMQVHYLKGFFLLRFLESVVGVDGFLEFLKEYVTQFHGQLVSSQDFFDLLFSLCLDLRQQDLTKEQLFEDWLDCAGMPKSLDNLNITEKNNILLQEVNAQVVEIRASCRQSPRRVHKKRKCSTDDGLHFRKFDPDQVVLLLDVLLDEDAVPNSVLEALRIHYSLQTANAEVRHRWCELVVREKALKYYDDVRSFLVKDQAMGVYLYGEMVISGCAKQKHIAVECFQLLRQDMPEGVIKTVHCMLYGD
ncbi:aminopeptidase O-like [Gigantopelta aegis]|uniref:aminopeptidase O-like n=1 Tax=Gigantopelta aegis TaxID=1735272 RepID=UPI001B88CA97|nr:aminopeptidase O-like [Gigantopelta aegis]